jgi:hypothetical protein
LHFLRDTKRTARAALVKAITVVSPAVGVLEPTVLLDGIEKMIQRGVLVRGVHFFQLGPRSQRLFRWDRIIELIEGTSSRCAGQTMVHDGRVQGRARGTPRQVIDAEKATTNLQRLLD